MFFYKFRVALALLLTAVPAGCLPLMTVGMAVSETRSARRSDPHRPGGGTGVAVVTFIVFVLLAVWSNLRLRRLIGRVRAARAAGGEGPFEMSLGATWTLIGATSAVGLVCGAYFLMLLSTI